MRGRAAGRIASWLTFVGLVAVGLGGPIAYALGSPAYSSGDEAAHVDYALQVWQGRLPVFEDGLVLQNDVGRRPPVQWTAQHPPLFYLLLAPAVGPLVDAGHVVGAAMAARGVVALLSVGLVFAVRWATIQLLPADRVPARAAIGTVAAVLVGTSVWFIRLGGSVYNDILAALVLTLALGALARHLRTPGPWTYVWFTAFVASAGLARFSALPLVAMLLLAFLLHRLIVERRPFLAGAWPPVASGLVLLAASGWFYVRNLLLAGNLSGGHPDWAVEHTGRDHRGLLDVATDRGFWEPMLQQFSARTTPEQPWAWLAGYGIVLLFALPLVAGLARVVASLVRRPAGLGTDVVLLAALLGSAALVAAMQVTHVAGAGSALPRYFFALLPYLAPIMALGLCAYRGWIAVLAAWLAVRLSLVVVEMDWTLARDLGESAPIWPGETWAATAVLLAGAATAAAGAVIVERRVATDARRRAPLH